MEEMEEDEEVGREELGQGAKVSCSLEQETVVLATTGGLGSGGVTLSTTCQVWRVLSPMVVTHLLSFSTSSSVAKGSKLGGCDP